MIRSEAVDQRVKTAMLGFMRTVLGFMGAVVSLLVVAWGLAAIAGTTSALAQSTPAVKQNAEATCEARLQGTESLASKLEQRLGECTKKLNPGVSADGANALKDLEGKLDGLFARIDQAIGRFGAERP
jgi:Zn-dependent alcohol dehydrogenase